MMGFLIVYLVSFILVMVSVPLIIAVDGDKDGVTIGDLCVGVFLGLIPIVNTFIVLGELVLAILATILYINDKINLRKYLDRQVIRFGRKKEKS